MQKSGNLNIYKVVHKRRNIVASDSTHKDFIFLEAIVNLPTLVHAFVRRAVALSNVWPA
jgi:hypothetical protein